MEIGYFSVTSVMLIWSRIDRGMILQSASTLVMRLRNCHFQSFQFSSGTPLKNFSLFLSKRKLGGSSTSVAGWPGGSSSAESSNKSFCLVVVACATLGCASFKLLNFFLFAAIVFFILCFFITLIKLHVKYFWQKFSKIFPIEATMDFQARFLGRFSDNYVYE